MRVEEARSTQDLARSRFLGEPVLVVAARQSEGRGRSGAAWDNAPRAVAVSLAMEVADSASRDVLSLLAGLAAKRALGETVSLKWPNDVLVGERKAGGILVELAGSVAVIGMGLNLWWPDSPEGVGALSETDPGPAAGDAIAGRWADELTELVRQDRWPRDEYRAACSTLGRRLTWEPDGSGRAVDIGADGSLVVETATGVMTLRSGSVQHVRGGAPG